MDSKKGYFQKEFVVKELTFLLNIQNPNLIICRPNKLRGLSVLINGSIRGNCSDIYISGHFLLSYFVLSYHIFMTLPHTIVFFFSKINNAKFL
jgi:hypothetical protein